MSLGGGYSDSMNDAVDAAIDKVWFIRRKYTFPILNASNSFLSIATVM